MFIRRIVFRCARTMRSAMKLAESGGVVAAVFDVVQRFTADLQPLGLPAYHSVTRAYRSQQ